MSHELHHRLPAGLGKVVFWEFVQNLPLVAGFLFGLDFWQESRGWLALACMLAGSLSGSMLIWATESRIVTGHREPLRVVVTNVVVMVLLMLLAAAYLSARWSSVWTDLVIGLVGGALLGVAQDLVAHSPIGAGHCAALALAFTLGLVGVRLLVANLPIVVNVLIITVVVTVAVWLVDYGPFRASHSVTT
jgi:hypothetical protein